MASQKTINRGAWADLILLSFIWGGSFLSMRIALDEIGVFSVVAHRVGWAALILWTYVLWRGLLVPRDLRVWAAFLVMGLLNNVIPFSLIAWGQLTIETGLAAILNATTAIFGVLIAAMVFADERLTLNRGFGVALGFAGVVTVIGWQAVLSFDPRSLAQLAILGASLSYGLASSWARATLGGMAPQVAAAGMLTGSSLILVPLAWVVDGPLTLALEADTLASIAFFAIAATAFAYLLYYRILASAGAGNLLVTTLLIVPVAVILGALFRGETLPPQAYAGFALLALGMGVLDGRILRPLRH